MGEGTTPKVEKICEFMGPKGPQWLLKAGDDYYVASGVTAAFTGWEVLVFPADENGEITNWGEVAGGRGITHEQAVEMLQVELDDAAASLRTDRP